MDNTPFPEFETTGQNPENQTCLAENLLQDLLTSTNSSTLEETLEFLLEASKTAQGRSELASKKTFPTILQLTQSLSSTHPLLFTSLKILRNLCAGEIANQNSFIEENGTGIVSIVLKSVDFGFPSALRLVLISLQLLGNVALAGGVHQSAIWGQFFPVEFWEVARIWNPEICDTLCMVIYTCCSGSRGRLEEISGVQGLPIMVEIVRTALAVGGREDWLLLFLLRICFEESHFLLLFSELCSTDASDIATDVKCRDTLFTPEQAYLLFLISEGMNQQIDKVTVSNEFALCVLEILKKASEVIDSNSRGKSSLPTGSPPIDLLGYSLNILRDICAQEDAKIVDSLLSLGILHLLLGLLRELEAPSIIRKSFLQGGNQIGVETSKDAQKVCPYKGFRRDIVAVIGNCTFRRKHVQDEIREQDGILLLMQQCVTDEDNPFLREWGIWTVRNLLEQNADNQKIVAELELQGSVNTPEITELGLRVEVDQKSRRAKLVNVS